MSTVSDRETPSPPSNSAQDRPPEQLLLDDPEADIVLRSCDHREFRVLKLYIVKVSPVLCEQIRSTLDSYVAVADTSSSLPSIQLSDSGATLFSLLTFILPMIPVLPSTTEQTMLLLSVAQKYQMNPILSHIRDTIASQDPPFIRSQTAFRVYSLAQAYELRQEVLDAARTTLTFPLTIEELEDELDTAPCIYLHELWKYHKRVQTHLRSDLTAFRTTGVSSVLTGFSCSNITSYGKLAWLDAYIGSIAVSPALFDLTTFHMCLSRHAISKFSNCQCTSIPIKTIHGFWMALTSVVHNSMAKVGDVGPPNCMVPGNNMDICIG